jgi:hypothetical protein
MRMCWLSRRLYSSECSGADSLCGRHHTMVMVSGCSPFNNPLSSVVEIQRAQLLLTQVV